VVVRHDIVAVFLQGVRDAAGPREEIDDSPDIAKRANDLEDLRYEQALRPDVLDHG